ncbi:alpha/beta hydrolase family protein [Actinomadura parmotrematis]|uniref:Poly(ethylene terephthalate) hydrolase n=1 Tax=Actinomadura parmotrematis TaxID=2864039 RepID=A0ABS7FP06_9ACTN|nr:alpha/beta hydrolase [Actinomadura parmotrematis]MBW8482129.1 alpha/beta hydrolase [Actinomadura parmotrematis]
MAPTPRRKRRATAAAALALGLALTGLGAAPAAQAADNPYERGPAPTNASIEALRGSFATSSTVVLPGTVLGFGGGTIYYPTSTSAGTFGAIAMAPGFTAYQSSLSWLGPRLASQGFVVFIIDTLTTADQPNQRGDELEAALDYLTQRSTVRTRIDATRLGVMGHSMGGGGTLEASLDRPSLQAAIPMTPWDLNTNFSADRVPTLIIGAQADTIAPVLVHSIPFYNSIPASSEKAYLELAGQSHFAPNTANTTIAKYSIAWLKRYIDNDTRYDQFLCPPPAATGAISQYRNTCPNS